MIFNCAVPLPIFIIPSMHNYEMARGELEGSLGALPAGWQHLRVWSHVQGHPSPLPVLGLLPSKKLEHMTAGSRVSATQSQKIILSPKKYSDV